MAPTVSELCDDYLERHARPKKRPKSIKDDESLINRYIRPEMGNKKVANIGRREIDELHQKLKKTPYQANRLLALQSKMFNLAVAWNWRSSNPVKGVERFPEDKRERWLTETEMGRLIRTLDEFEDRRAANAIQLILLTGARRGEVLNATWDQFDLERGVWTKPSHHTKQKKMSHVPLNGPAQKLLANIRADAVTILGSERALTDFPFVFPGDAQGKPLQELKKSWAAILRKSEIDNARMHDLRHNPLAARPEHHLRI